MKSKQTITPIKIILAIYFVLFCLVSSGIIWGLNTLSERVDYVMPVKDCKSNTITTLYQIPSDFEMFVYDIDFAIICESGTDYSKYDNIRTLVFRNSQEKYCMFTYVNETCELKPRYLSEP